MMCTLRSKHVPMAGLRYTPAAMRARLTRHLIAALLLVALLSWKAFPAAAQDDTAVILTPPPGGRVQGIVAITGSAAHPAFVRYELSFGFDPNPTDTWFPIGAPVEAPLTDGTLAEWDTTVIADGTYMLRLQVFTADSNAPTEFISRGIVVQNSTPTPSPTPPPDTATPPPSPTSPVILPPTSTIQPTAAPAPSQTPSAARSAEESPPGGDILARLSISAYAASFCRGALWTFAGFFLLWTYSRLRSLARPRFRRWLRRTLSDLRRP